MKKIFFIFYFLLFSIFTFSNDLPIYQKPENRKVLVYAPFNFEFGIKWKNYKYKFKEHDYDYVIKNMVEDADPNYTSNQQIVPQKVDFLEFIKKIKI